MRSLCIILGSDSCKNRKDIKGNNLYISGTQKYLARLKTHTIPRNIPPHEQEFEEAPNGPN